MVILQKMEQTKAFKEIGARLSRRLHPSCQNYTWGTEDYWRCYIREDAHIAYHQTSTCKMGSIDDPTTVVDPQLRYGHCHFITLTKNRVRCPSEEPQHLERVGNTCSCIRSIPRIFHPFFCKKTNQKRYFYDPF